MRQEYKRFRDHVNTLLIAVNLMLDQSVLETLAMIRVILFQPLHLITNQTLFSQELINLLRVMIQNNLTETLLSK